MTEAKPTTPIRAIRAKCLDCMCGSAQEVRLCPCQDCPLYPYRMGHNPNRKGMGGNIKALSAKKSNSACESETNEDTDENLHTASDDEKS